MNVKHPSELLGAVKHIVETIALLGGVDIEANPLVLNNQLHVFAIDMYGCSQRLRARVLHGIVHGLLEYEVQIFALRHVELHAFQVVELRLIGDVAGVAQVVDVTLHALNNSSYIVVSRFDHPNDVARVFDDVFGIVLDSA